MNRAGLLREVLLGRLLIVGEFRGAHAAMDGYVDRTTGEKIGYVKAIILAECTVRGNLARAMSVAPVQASNVAGERFDQLGSQGSELAQGVSRSPGKSVVVAYVLFGISALFLPFVSLQGVPLTSGGSTLPWSFAGNGSSGNAMGVLLVLVSLASVAVPYLWKDKRASLAFCVPMLITRCADYNLYQAYSALSTVRNSVNGIFPNLVSANASVGPGIGAYATSMIAAYIAYCGINRSRSSSEHAKKYVTPSPLELPITRKNLWFLTSLAFFVAICWAPIFVEGGQVKHGLVGFWAEFFHGVPIGLPILAIITIVSLVVSLLLGWFARVLISFLVRLREE